MCVLYSSSSFSKQELSVFVTGLTYARSFAHLHAKGASALLSSSCFLFLSAQLFLNFHISEINPLVVEECFYLWNITKTSETFSPIGFLFSNKTINFCPQQTEHCLVSKKNKQINRAQLAFIPLKIFNRQKYISKGYSQGRWLSIWWEMPFLFMAFSMACPIEICKR